MTDTFPSDSGVKYDIVEEEWSRTYPTGRTYIQKSSQSSEVQKGSPAPTESEKQDFWKSLITFMRNEWLFDWNIGSHQKFKNFLSSNWYL